MSAEYYKNLLKSNQITPAAIEQKIRELELALDDAKYFGGKPQTELDNLQIYIANLKQVLAEDYALAVARGLEYGPVLPAVEPIVEKTTLIGPKVAFEGTVFTNDESREVARLLLMAREGRITKATLLDFINSLDDQIAALRRNDPSFSELLMQKVMLQHVVFTGVFKERKFRY